MESDQLILPFLADSEQAVFAESKIAKHYELESNSNRVNAFYLGVPDPVLAKEVLKFRNQIREQKANLQDVAQHVKIIPIVMQLLKSPFYRTELAE